MHVYYCVNQPNQANVGIFYQTCLLLVLLLVACLYHSIYIRFHFSAKSKSFFFFLQLSFVLFISKLETYCCLMYHVMKIFLPNCHACQMARIVETRQPRRLRHKRLSWRTSSQDIKIFFLNISRDFYGIKVIYPSRLRNQQLLHL